MSAVGRQLIFHDDRLTGNKLACFADNTRRDNSQGNTIVYNTLFVVLLTNMLADPASFSFSQIGPTHRCPLASTECSKYDALPAPTKFVGRLNETSEYTRERQRAEP